MHKIRSIISSYKSGMYSIFKVFCFQLKALLVFFTVSNNYKGLPFQAPKYLHTISRKLFKRFQQLFNR